MAMHLWLITFGDGKDIWKSKHYRSEQAFNTYWKYHTKFEAWRRSCGWDGHILIGYKDGIEIRRQT